ncbi:MAG: YwbE family protein [Bacteroidia bacterium]|nr:YwbE family protein [Bacteroidia bacterium]MCZ2248016.1 YwbE family protein [Bacteroidia bacterium]
MKYNQENDSNQAHYRANIKIGLPVAVVLKKNQKTGKRTYGKVQWILTSAAYHSRGIKVVLDNRQIGRVQEIMPEET